MLLRSGQLVKFNDQVSNGIFILFPFLILTLLSTSHPTVSICTRLGCRSNFKHWILVLYIDGVNNSEPIITVCRLIFASTSNSVMLGLAPTPISSKRILLVKSILASVSALLYAKNVVNAVLVLVSTPVNLLLSISNVNRAVQPVVIRVVRELTAGYAQGKLKPFAQVWLWQLICSKAVQLDVLTLVRNAQPGIHNVSNVVWFWTSIVIRGLLPAAR